MSYTAGNPIDYSNAPLIQQFYRTIIHEPIFEPILHVQRDATVIWADKKAGRRS